MDAQARGVMFPEVDGRRSTTATGTAVLADAVRDIDPALAGRIAGEQGWRSSYARHVRDLVVASVRTPDAAVSAAREGLASLHRRFVMSTADGDVPLAAAMAAPPPPRLGSVVVEGTGQRETALSLPYGGRRLRGDDLHRQLDDWVRRGIVEPSHAEAVRLVMANPDWLDLTDRSFALLGAGAEMAPLHALTRWGATVHAVDVPRPEVWRRIVDVARAGAGRVVVPVREETLDPHAGAPSDPADGAGADLLTEAPAVRRWLSAAEGPLVVGNYVYADGALFARLSVAVDALSAALLEDRPDTVLAMLATPTDVFVVPAEAVAHARERYGARRGRRVLQAPAQALSGRRLFVPNYRVTVALPDGRELGVADCLVAQQGPNYALAKQLQRWRSVAAQAGGATVSANVAPPTRTRSVLKNRALAAAYAGAHRFGVEVFAPATSSTLMAALLVHDLRNRPARLGHPHDLFMLGANHGGLWRLAYEPRSVLGLAVLLGYAQRG